MSATIAKTYLASGAIADRRIVKPHATIAGAVVLAAAATDVLVGISVAPKGAADGDRIDVQHTGEALVEAGAAFAAGALLTSDGTGRAIISAPAAAANNRIVAMALEAAAAAGDLVRVIINPSSLQG